MVLISSIVFIIITSCIGVYLSRNVKTVKSYAVADRSLPLYISTATVFATWFGAEAILGIPESFMEHGIVGIISDPIGAFICLLVLGLFFARRFYRMNVITIVDFFYNRYGKLIEILVGIAICLSYVGWIAAQFIAFGHVFSFMLDGSISPQAGILLGAAIIVLYTFKGGMLAIAINDFIQTVIIFTSLLFMFFIVSNMAGGPVAVWDFAVDTHRTDIHFDKDYPNYTFLIGIFLSMILGTIPQQDSFQRITSSKSEKVAVQSTILGALVYLFVTMIPIFIVLAATKIQLESGNPTPDDFNLYIVYFVKDHIPAFVQVFFFGSLFAAILSTASGTILATSVVLSRNVLGEFFRGEANLLVVRITLVLVTLFVCLFALFSQNSIHQLVEDSGKVTMVVAFFPLIFGMFYQRTSYVGVLAGIILSTVVWLSMISYQNWNDVKLSIAPEVVGFIVSFGTIVLGSFFFPDGAKLKHEITHHRHIRG
ncbi:MAG: sodium:solute symporter family protein [Parachlamydiaceae bacterium]|nr:sodium:solute symporter family protein [Parachlamydiaceae bacterium]